MLQKHFRPTAYMLPGKRDSANASTAIPQSVCLAAYSTRQTTHIAYHEKQSKVQQAHTYVLKNVSIVSDVVMSSASSCLKLFEGGVDALLDVSIGHQQH